MRLLFEIDTKDYTPGGVAFTHRSARCIHIREGRAAMVHSAKYDYYVFPGGTIEGDESPEAAMIREAREEAGLVVVPQSVRPYGRVHLTQKSERPGVNRFVQDACYYLCQVEDGLQPQKLDDYESEESFALTYITPQQAIAVNRNGDHKHKDPVMLEREARVLECLMADGYFD